MKTGPIRIPVRLIRRHALRPASPRKLSRRSRFGGGRPLRSWQIGDPHYRVTWADAIRAHDEALLSGGAPGILNRSSIESALVWPYHGYHQRLHQKAAALVHGIVADHGFVDGNKRTALYLVELLVVRSGYRLVVEGLVLADAITAVARGQ